MNATLLSAMAALFGASIAGLTSVVTQRTQAKAEWLAHDRIRRQDLYKEFIEEASHCYVHALQHDEPDLAALVSLFAKISRIRVQSSTEVAREAVGVRELSGWGVTLANPLSSEYCATCHLTRACM
jgi:hypothetical protein